MSYFSIKDCLLILLLTSLSQNCDQGEYKNFQGECKNCLQNCKGCYTSVTCSSCFDGYYLKQEYTTFSCPSCPLYCKICDQKDVCQICKDHYFLNGNSCSECHASCGNCETISTNCISCPNGQLLYHSNCVSCTSPCLTCQNDPTNCTSCVNNNLIVLFSQCICNDGYYTDGSDCIMCSHPCLTCQNSSDECTSCVSSFQLSQTIEHRCECQTGYMEDEYQICKKCQEPCKTCSQSVNKCLSCIDNNQQLDQINKICLCKTGWIFDTDHKNCLQCQLPCKACVDSVNKCIICNDEIHQSGDTCNCQPGWINDQNYICIQCEQPCKTCKTSTNQCETCLDPNHYLNSSQSCVCQSGYYSDTLITCTKCKEPCKECNINGCINCIDINQILDKDFKCICKDNYYSNGVNCYQCQKPCETCIDTFNKCLSCLDNNQYVQNYQCKCKKGYIKFEEYCCDQNCETCLGVDHCDKCKKGFFLNGKNTCLSCIKNCEFCANQNYCEICYDGYTVSFDRQCISCIPNCKHCINQQECIQCMDGYYIEQNYCIQCNQNCQTCQISPQICLSCRIYYEINMHLNTCQCINGYYEYNNQCLECIYPCKKCLNQEQCQECVQISNIFLNQQNKCECNQGYYFYHKSCVSCDPKCQTCIDNSFNCLTCDYTKFRILKGNSCLCINNYFENENNVCYPCKSDQGKIVQSCNYQDSTDLVWTYGEECDDGNEVSRDGCSTNQINLNYSCINVILQQSICFQCSSNCIKCELDQIQYRSICNKCESGYFLDLNQCVICQKNCLECINQPYNCLKCRYQQKSNNQCLDCEISKGYYINELDLNCYSKCGDGIITQEEECDDGNILKGDGCNQLCQLENNYIFYNGLSIIPVYPKPYLQSVGNSQLYSNIRQFKLSYNVELLIKEDFQIKEFIMLYIQKEKNANSIDQQFELIQEIQQSDEPSKVKLNLIINISFLRSSSEESLLIKFNNITQIKSFSGYSQLDNEVICNIPQLIFIEDSTILKVQVTTQSNSYILYFIGAMFCCSLIFGGIDVFYNLLDNLQMLSYLKYLNLDFPYNLKLYFDLFGFAQINFIEKIFDISLFLNEIIDLKQIKQNPKKIANEYSTPLSIINMSSIIVIWISLIAIYQISKVIPRFFYSLKFKFYQDLQDDSLLVKIGIFYLQFKYIIIKFCQMIITELFYSGILRVHMATAYDFAFSVALQLQSLDLYSQNAFICLNSYFGLSAIGLYFSSIYFIIQISEMKQYSFNCCSVKQKYGSVFEGLQKKSISKYFNAILLIKKLIFMIIIVFGYNFPLFQVCSIGLLSTQMSLFLIIFKPLEDFKESIKQLSCEINITFTLIFIIFLTLDKELMFFTYETQQNIGWVCIFFMTSLLFIQLIVDSIQQWKLLYKKYKQIRNLYNYFQNTIHPKEIQKPTSQIEQQNVGKFEIVQNKAITGTKG